MYTKKCFYDGYELITCDALSSWIANWIVKDVSRTEIINNLPNCPFCLKELHKPEPKPYKIIKSGNTWVAEYHGKNYVWIRTTFSVSTPPFFDVDCESRGAKVIDFHWKRFDEDTHLTDRLALVRPLVNTQSLGICELINVNKEEAHYNYSVYNEDTRETDEINECHLATVKEIDNDI